MINASLSGDKKWAKRGKEGKREENGGTRMRKPTQISGGRKSKQRKSSRWEIGCEKYERMLIDIKINKMIAH